MDFAELSLSTPYRLAYELFVEARAAHTGKSVADIQIDIASDTFESQLRALHSQYLNREMTLIRLADLLDVSAAHLHNILDAAGLPLRGARPRFCNL